MMKSHQHLAPNLTPVVREGDLAPDDLDELRGSALTAWDLETSGLDYRSHSIGTVQIANDRGRTWIVQVLPDHHPRFITTLLSDPVQRKVFHFAPFDLGFMRYHWSVRAQNVACTKVLHRLVAPSDTNHSLQHLLLSKLGVAITKDDSIRRSDWSAQNLSSDQLTYATKDVAYLLTLYDVLMEEALVRGVSRLAEQSFDYLPSRVETELLGIEDLFAY